jgi:hypothetical protein
MAALIVEVARNPELCEQLAEEVRTVSRNGPTLDDLAVCLSNRLDDHKTE